MNDAVDGIAAGLSPEEKRALTARWMFDFLLDRQAWYGCRDWDGLDPKVRGAFTDMAAFLESRES